MSWTETNTVLVMPYQTPKKVGIWSTKLSSSLRPYTKYQLTVFTGCCNSKVINNPSGGKDVWLCSACRDLVIQPYDPSLHSAVRMMNTEMSHEQHKRWVAHWTGLRMTDFALTIRWETL